MAQKKTVSNKPKAKAMPRQLESPRYKSFRISKRIRHPKSLPGAWSIMKLALGHVRRYWRPLLGITFVYLLLTLLFVKGIGNSLDVPLLKQTMLDFFKERTSQFSASVAIFGVLAENAVGASTESAVFYQGVILLLCSLALVWALRQTYANIRVTVRDSFYKGMYPLIPFLLVLLVIGLQLLPFLFGNSLFRFMVQGGLAATDIEKVLWGLLFFLLAVLSFYMISSSVFALYIVTLPDMTPMQALRSARELVRYRRWTVMRKLLFLPIVLFVIGAVVTIPLIMFAAFAAAWLFFIMNIVALLIIHSYIYALYRELL
jgi:hypothetical protein